MVRTRIFSLLFLCLIALGLAGCTTMLGLVIGITNYTNSNRYVDFEKEYSWVDQEWNKKPTTVRFVYSEPVFDNYRFFNEEWTEYRDNFGAWFNKRLKKSAKNISKEVFVKQVGDDAFSFVPKAVPLDSGRVQRNARDTLRIPSLKTNEGIAGGVNIIIAPILVYTENHKFDELDVRLVATYAIVNPSSQKILAYGKVRTYGLSRINDFDIVSLMVDEIVSGTPLALGSEWQRFDRADEAVKTDR